MADHRRPEIPFTDAPRGTCRWCGQWILHEDGERSGEVNRRRRWHPACSDEYNLSDPREARRAVRKRDRGRCRSCKLDTYALARAHKGRGRTRKLRDLGFKPRQSLWELDHIVPLIDGGSHDLENMQTLCVPCHEQKTAAEARERARLRRYTGLPAKEPDAKRTPRQSHASEKREKLDIDALLDRADEANLRAGEALAALERGES